MYKVKERESIFCFVHSIFALYKRITKTKTNNNNNDKNDLLKRKLLEKGTKQDIFCNISDPSLNNANFKSNDS